jgi:hypothetical protein
MKVAVETERLTTAELCVENLELGSIKLNSEVFSKPYQRPIIMGVVRKVREYGNTIVLLVNSYMLRVGKGSNP